jgi:hypothetical protein
VRGVPNKAAARARMVTRILINRVRMRIPRIGRRNVTVVSVRLRRCCDDV